MPPAVAAPVEQVADRRLRMSAFHRCSAVAPSCPTSRRRTKVSRASKTRKAAPSRLYREHVACRDPSIVGGNQRGGVVALSTAPGLRWTRLAEAHSQSESPIVSREKTAWVEHSSTRR